jgi:4-oxalocrotonate tautomerase
VIAEITGTLQRVLGKDPRLTHVVIAEIDTDDWGWAGETTTAIRARDTAPWPDGPR